jgi:hypothetical protein
MNQGVSLEEAQRAKTKALQVFNDLVGQAAVGISKVGKTKFGLKVNLSESPDEQLSLPHEIDGVPVTIEVVGTIRKR